MEDGFKLLTISAIHPDRNTKYKIKISGNLL